MANTAREHPPLPCESSSQVHAESTAGSEFTFTKKMRELRPRASRLTRPGQDTKGLVEKKDHIFQCERRVDLRIRVHLHVENHQTFFQKPPQTVA